MDIAILMHYAPCCGKSHGKRYRIVADLEISPLVRRQQLALHRPHGSLSKKSFASKETRSDLTYTFELITEASLYNKTSSLVALLILTRKHPTQRP